MSRPALIALFAYNRPRHLARTLEALAANRRAGESTLHVFSDGPKPDATAADRHLIDEARRVVAGRRWCREVIVHERDRNLGLAASIRAGVSSILESNERVIVLEDDIETSPGFLNYMNDALDAYESSADVMHISAYLPATSYQNLLPGTFRAKHMSCWGWATWRRAWNVARWNASQLLAELDRAPGGRSRFDLDGAADFSRHLEANLRGELRTWAVFWAASIYLAGGDCLFPGSSLARNIGTDGTGENFRTDETQRYAVALADSIAVGAKSRRESRLGRAYLRSFYRYGRDSRITTRARLALGRAKHSVAQRLRPA